MEAVAFERDSNEKVLINTRSEGAKIAFLAGKPFDEPIVKYGPFVMHS